MTRIIRLCCATLLLSACAGESQRDGAAPLNSVETDAFTASIRPVCAGAGCGGFELRIVNLSDQDIEIDWNKTLYVRNGNTYGGFMYQGVTYAERNALRSPDIVFRNANLRKTIWPSNLATPRGRHAAMPEGEQGIYLTLGVNGKETSYRLRVNVDADSGEAQGVTPMPGF